MTKTCVIVNPRSGSGAAGRRLPELESLLSRHLTNYQLRLTEREGDGDRLAREAAAHGASRVVVAGGDGTVSEVVSGLFEAGASHTELGIVPFGSGADFARLLGLGRDLSQMVARIERGKRRVVDVGKLSYRDRDNRSCVRWFLNITSFGMSGQAMLWLSEQGRRGKRGPFSYMESGVRGLFSYHSPPVRVTVDGELVHHGKLLLGAVANGRFFGAGMQVTPSASIDDGLFDIMLVGDLSKFSALLLFPKLMLGRHLTDPRIRFLRGRVVELESSDEIWLEADGEPVGRLPARLELSPAALHLCGLP